MKPRRFESATIWSITLLVGAAAGAESDMAVASAKALRTQMKEDSAPDGLRYPLSSILYLFDFSRAGVGRYERYAPLPPAVAFALAALRRLARRLRLRAAVFL